MAFNISIDTSSLNQAANLLGVNNWQLQTAKFAGVSFFIVPNSWDKFNPLEPEFQIANQLFGDSDPNSVLSSSTSLTMQNIKDSQNRKLAVYSLPNYDGFVINDQGMNGSVYEFTGLFIGDDYLTAIRNIETALSTQSSNGYEFIHPMCGALSSCYCQQFQFLYNYNEWKAATYNIRIVQELPRSITNTKTSITQILSKILSNINASINAINRISIDTQLVDSIINHNSIFNSSLNATPSESTTGISAFTISNNIINSTNLTGQILNSATSLVYQQLIYKQVTNYNFANNVINYNNLPPMYRYAKIRTVQFDNLLQYYSNNVTDSINLYVQYGLDTIYSSDITTLKISLSQFNDLLKTILNQIEQTYTTYTVPYTMSFRTLFYLNGLDFNNSSLIQTLIESNINILEDLNVIPKNLVLTLPKGI